MRAIDKVKADFTKHWLSWIGFIGLVLIFFTGYFHRPSFLVAVILSWVLTIGWLSIEIEYEKKHGYHSDEELREIYDNHPAITITLPGIKRRK